MYPFLKKLFADGGYQGPEFQKALAKILPHLETEIVKRSGRGGARKTMIVALARKLLIALWRMVTTGEIPEGIALRPAIA